MPRAARNEPVHPRACGERSRGRVSARADCGSSPRLRGTRLSAPGSGIQSRFIPAPAGNASCAALMFAWVSVHPRACGERDHAGPYQALHKRFIPAPAGNAFSHARTAGDDEVHPRACGERESPYIAAEVDRGPSPRLRGTPDRQRLGRLPLPVHPRACGERVCNEGMSLFSAGSSPRLRGTLLHGDGCHAAHRFIPAPAGNAEGISSSSSLIAVHPRACGERVPTRTLSAEIDGSSPRLRGTQLLFRDAPECTRFIPAPAGNAPAWCRGNL